MLIDTGSDQSYINPAFIKQRKIIKIHPVKITTALNTETISEKVILPGLPEFQTNQPLHFFLYKFHKHFDGLIGMNIILQLNIDIHFSKQILLLPTHEIQLLYGLTTNENINNVENTKTETAKIRTSHLNSDETKIIQNLCNKYRKIFQNTQEYLSTTSEITHSIKTTSDKPIFTRAYRHPYAQKEEIRSQIQELLKNQIIQPSRSPWSSPACIVSKKPDASGKQKFRMVIDYRKLNQITIDDKYPIPNIDEILDQLSNCQYFTTLDLASGFHQIKMNSKDIEKTAFSVEFGHYEYLRMPFGLKNAPSTFQRLMNNILNGLQGQNCLCYMDDIIVFSPTLKSHIHHLEKVFQKLENANLKVQLDKSEFLHGELSFLGHVISKEGIKPNQNKIEAIQRMTIPKTTKQIKAFLGLVGYYRKFIKNFAEKTKPLTKRLKKDVKINSNDEDYVKSFEECKTLLCNKPILNYPDFSKPFVLTTDASNYAIGAILSQNPNDLPISYASRTLNKAEINYSATEKELLAIIWAVKHFRPYLYGKTFEIITDHKPLQWLMNLKEPNSKLVRWKLKLEEYDYTVKYKKGITNLNADALSRIEINNSNSSDTEIENERGFFPTTETKLNQFKRQIILKRNKEFQGNNFKVEFKVLHTTMTRYTITAKEFTENIVNQILLEYVNPKILTGIACEYATQNIIKRLLRETLKGTKFKLLRCKYIVEDIEDEMEQIRIIKNIHDSGHRGITENILKIKEHYFFPKTRSLTTKYINKCDICMKNKYDRHKTNIELQITETPKRPLEIVHIDTFQISQQKYLTIIDKFTKFAHAFKLENLTSPIIIENFLNYIGLNGIPNKLVADNGVEFTSNHFKDICKLYNIELHFTTANNSTGNSPIERLHSTLIETYRVLTAQNPSDPPNFIMQKAIIVYNNTIHSSTQKTPFEMKNGHCFDKNEIFPKKNEENLHEYVKLHKQKYDQLCSIIARRNKEFKVKQIGKLNKNRVPPPNLKVGEIVYKKRDRRTKTEPKFSKQIVNIDKGITFTNNLGKKIHKNKIKRNITLQDNNNSGTSYGAT